MSSREHKPHSELRVQEIMVEFYEREEEIDHLSAAREMAVAIARLEEQFDALRDLVLNVEGPWDIDQDCRWCSGHYDWHEETCVWARAMDALGVPNLACHGGPVRFPASEPEKA